MDDEQAVTARQQNIRDLEAQLRGAHINNGDAVIDFVRRTAQSTDASAASASASLQALSEGAVKSVIKDRQIAGLKDKIRTLQTEATTRAAAAGGDINALRTTLDDVIRKWTQTMNDMVDIIELVKTASSTDYVERAFRMLEGDDAIYGEKKLNAVFNAYTTMERSTDDFVTILADRVKNSTPGPISREMLFAYFLPANGWAAPWVFEYPEPDYEQTCTLGRNSINSIEIQHILSALSLIIQQDDRTAGNAIIPVHEAYPVAPEPMQQDQQPRPSGLSRITSLERAAAAAAGGQAPLVIQASAQQEPTFPSDTGRHIDDAFDTINGGASNNFLKSGSFTTDIVSIGSNTRNLLVACANESQKDALIAIRNKAVDKTTQSFTVTGINDTDRLQRVITQLNSPRSIYNLVKQADDNNGPPRDAAHRLPVLDNIRDLTPKHIFKLLGLYFYYFGQGGPPEFRKINWLIGMS